MPNYELITVILDIIAVVVVNGLIFMQKKTLYESKYLWIFFFFVKSAVLLPALLMIFQLYIFAFKFFGAVGNDMYHNVYFCYLGYIIIAGFILFMEEHQVNLLRLMSVALCFYQGYMSYILMTNGDMISSIGSHPLNMFYPNYNVGVFICWLGTILSVLGVLTVWNYWRGNNKVDFV